MTFVPVHHSITESGSGDGRHGFGYFDDDVCPSPPLRPVGETEHT